MSHDQVRIKLNQVTGLSIKDTDSIQDTMPKYLQRLKEISGQ